MEGLEEAFQPYAQGFGLAEINATAAYLQADAEQGHVHTVIEVRARLAVACCACCPTCQRALQRITDCLHAMPLLPHQAVISKPPSLHPQVHNQTVTFPRRKNKECLDGCDSWWVHLLGQFSASASACSLPAMRS